MANGSVARLPCTPEPPSAPAFTGAGKPGAGIETTIGEAVASAATGICFALMEHQNGGLRPETRTAIGERVAAVVVLQLNHELGDDDFTHKARGARHILRQCFDAEYFLRYTPEQGDAAIDFYIDELLTIVGHVVRDERTLRAAGAN